MIKNIVFDIGDVLVGYSSLSCAKHYHIDYAKLEETNQILVKDKKWRQYLNGLIQVEDLLRYFITLHSNREIEFRLLLEKKYQNEILFLIEENVALLKKLKQEGYFIYLLSNITKETLETILEQYDFTTYIDGDVFSYQEHISKPDERIYRILIDRYQLNVKETLFIDDRMQNVMVARQLGMKAIEYQKEHPLCFEMIKEIGRG